MMPPEGGKRRKKKEKKKRKKKGKEDCKDRDGSSYVVSFDATKRKRQILLPKK